MGILSGRVAAILFAASFLPLAQAQTGEIHLQVTDSSGAAMQARGTLRNSASGVQRGFRTDSQGGYNFPALPYGAYRLEVSRNGFSTQNVAIEVSSSSPVSKTVSLVVGSAAFALDVVGVTPLAGVELPVEQTPAAVQTLNNKDLEADNAISLPESMNRRLANVFVNETQNNPFQPDVNYRGYTASPLLGTPEGMSVYMDGVRLNQPFGDVVSWDLIPKIAISEIALLPGSNPLFGLNTLGGSLALRTKDGSTRPGTSVQVSGGSFGRRAVEFDHGWANSKGFNWYLAGNLFHEDGWRVASPTDVRQAFSKIGWQGAKTSISLTGSYADNELIGNGVQDQALLRANYNSIYTVPDRTNNHAPFLNLTARHTPNTRLTFSGNLYFRYIRADTFNGDVNDDSLDQSIYQPSAGEITALRNAGYTGVPASGATAANTPFPFWRCIGQVLLNDEPGEKCDGQINRTYTRQHNWGLSGQMTLFSSPQAHHNQLTVGFAHDRSSVGFQQTGQLGYINPDRSITPVNAIEDGVHAGNVDGDPLDARVYLRGLIHTTSFYGTDTFIASHGWTVTASGRYNRTILDNTDRLLPAAGPGSLTSHNIFQRFNPAIGFTFAPKALVNFYGGYTEGSRAPTSIELGCADPTQPCKLPNAFAGDPPLKQVVTRTIEAGVRSGSESMLVWNAGYFFTQNSNDLLFVSSTATGFGYFKNFGKTRRQGIELGLRARLGRLTLGENYTFLDATYQSSETIDGTGNSSNNGGRGLEGTIQIRPGNRLPLTPRHQLKAFADWQVTRRLSVDADLISISSSVARGNENNLNRPDGLYYLGAGTSPAYGIVNLGGHYQILRQLQLFVQVNNLFDRKYYTAAQLGGTAFDAAGRVLTRPFPAVAGEFPVQQTTFLAPGAPIGAFGGIRVTF